ncbi:DUF2313 domain-containing protein [Paenibacillus sp. GYB004]|uniref:putative phage tail protein n=1 Tax=Paenibacillus sp. GYB004 TaxID=2994393 RepID=UPI002F9624E0
MSHSQKMLLRLQPFMRKSSVYKAIFDAEAGQFDGRDAAIADLRLQLSVDTATWALGVYEAELGIVTESGKPIAERRSVVKSKMRGTGKVDAALIKLVADSFSNGDVVVQFDGTIKITFTSVVGTPPNLQDLKLAIEDIKPAHLGVIYIFLYNQYQQLAPYTHDYLAQFTYEQLRSSDIT